MQALLSNIVAEPPVPVTDPWFAIRTRSNHEKAACANLGLKDFQTFLPVCRVRNRWVDRFRVVEIPLFRGYVFARFERSLQNAVLSTPGVLQIVGHGGYAEPVLDCEISALQRAVAINAEFQECDFFTKGNRAAIISGPMAGVEGTVVSLKHKSCLILSISLLQRSVSLEIDASVVRIEPEPFFPRSSTQ
jgi:transcription termination/antitermination protein NusG